jgi:hypothetical protein
MIIAVVDLIIFVVGCVAISTVIVLGIVTLLDKGLDALDALILRHSIPSRPSSSHLPATNQIRERRGYKETEIRPTNDVIQSHEIPHTVGHILIAMAHQNGPFQKALAKIRAKDECRQENNSETNKKSLGYRTDFFPIKHLGNIVGRLRRHVNQSGKEPEGETTVTINNSSIAGY